HPAVRIIAIAILIFVHRYPQLISMAHGDWAEFSRSISIVSRVARARASTPAAATAILIVFTSRSARDSRCRCNLWRNRSYPLPKRLKERLFMVVLALPRTPFLRPLVCV